MNWQQVRFCAGKYDKPKSLHAFILIANNSIQNMDYDKFALEISCIYMFNVGMKPKDSSIKSHIEPCLALKLRQANRVLTQIYDQDMNGQGIKITQFAMLRAIYYMGEATNRSLQEVLVLDQTTLSRNLKPLIRDGYLQSQPGRDKREKVLQLTDEGKALFKSASKDWRHTQQQLKATLGDELVDKLLSVGDAIVELKDNVQ